MMKNSLFVQKLIAFFFLFAFLALDSTKAQVSNYFNGFEIGVGVDDWADVVRVASGTNSIISATGSFHAEVDIPNGGFTRFGHVGGGSYNPVFPVFGYKTSLDIYLDVNHGFANDTRVDYSSAINDIGGTFRRDFVYNIGFYNDAIAPGTGNRFVISASNNAGRAGAFPKNPGKLPQVISTTGWYRFEHSFTNVAGVLKVIFTIYNAALTPVATWTVSDPSDIIGTTVGGARYGWVLNNEFSLLAIDNSSLTINPPPTVNVPALGAWGLIIFALLLLSISSIVVFQRKRIMIIFSK
ncbi:MAG: hypothetical protein ABIO44_13325 [Saprospiraceae bacterium]